MRIEILERIGSGSHGEVFTARDVKTGEEVAVKIPRKEFPNENQNEFSMLKTIFSSEDNLSAKKCILQPVFLGKVVTSDGGAESESDCLVMPLCRFSLADFLHAVDLTKLTEKIRLSFLYSVFSPLLDALTVLDKLKIHHTDIKPGNILWDDQAKTWKLVDFGTARTYRPSGPETNDCGTMQFRAPEYCAHGDSEDGPWSDIYSLGKIVELLLNYREIQNDSNAAHFIANLSRYTDARKARQQHSVSLPNIVVVSQETKSDSLSLFSQFELIAERAAAILPEDRPTLGELALLRRRIGDMYFAEQFVSNLLTVAPLNPYFFDPSVYFDDEQYCRASPKVDSHALSVASPVRSPGRTPGRLQSPQSQSPQRLAPTTVSFAAGSTDEPAPVNDGQSVVASPVAFFPGFSGWGDRAVLPLGFQFYQEGVASIEVKEDLPAPGL